MKETILSLAGDTLFLLVIAGIFLAASLFAYAVLERGRIVMANYKETFTESASANMADMFMFVDATRLFYINLLAIFIIPLFVWILIRDLPTALAVFGMLAILPGLIYRNMRKKRLRKFEEQLPDGLLMISGA
ncbi:MAG: secretion system protein F, partial [Gammaproteobacteria bacterium]|nr:secretion system protein F [Gammaproteobacteria bacterium]NIO61311.1 secretion system protein F [Gammaproteobacteria bacterium]NIT39969.1 secretion system protein F [Gammaproteobacteria bacterium]